MDEQPFPPSSRSDDEPVGAPPRFGGWAPPPPPDGWAPAPGGWQQPPWGEPPPVRPRRRTAAAAIAIALIAVSGLAIAVGVPGLFGSNGQQGILGSIFNGNGSIDSAGISARVTPEIVDITASAPDGLVAGTGMVITSGGEVLTNNHVVDGASAIEAQIGGTGSTYRARVVGTDPGADVALLQLQGASGLQTVSAGSAPSVGDPVVAIGNALGREGPPTASAGQVTAVNRTITATDDSGLNSETLTGLIEVDANVLPGDSGGPLVDRSGKVVGMDTAASARHFRFRTGTSQGFAIPIATAMAVVQQLRSGGGGQATPGIAATARLGVQLDDSFSGQPGARVVAVQAGSPAESAGIVAGDVIVTFDGSDVQSPSELRDAVRSHRPGDRVVVVWEDPGGQQHAAGVVLASASV